MLNFSYLSPTKLIFGKDTENQVGEEIKLYSKKILLHYGGGSIKKSGLYSRIVESLKEAKIDFIELSGVQPNPRLSLVKEGIKACRENHVDFILAVGGGSVIDSAKAIAIGTLYDGDVWDFYTGKALPVKTLPVGVVLTIPAAGSEASKSSVITNEDGWYKRSLNIELIKPKFAIMNPELTFTLPPYQTACGVADIMAHIIERYFTTTAHVDLTDRLCEGALKAVIENAPLLFENTNNYDARAEIMWASTLAHNDLLSTGRIGDFASHQVEHEMSGIYDVAHGAGLAVVLPAWMKYTYSRDVTRFVKFAVRVWNVENYFDSPERTALEGIQRMTDFFKQIGLPTTLGELSILDDRLEEMASKCTNGGTKTVGNCTKLNKEDVLQVLKLAL